MIWKIPVNIRPDNKIIDAPDEKNNMLMQETLFQEVGIVEHEEYWIQSSYSMYNRGLFALFNKQFPK